MNNQSVEPIENKDQLIKYFTDGIKQDHQLKIGVEHEKFLFNKNNLKRIDYSQIIKYLKFLSIKVGSYQSENGKVVGLKRDNQKITTEPGFQYELSELHIRIYI